MIIIWYLLLNFENFQILLLIMSNKNTHSPARAEHLKEYIDDVLSPSAVVLLGTILFLFFQFTGRLVTDKRKLQQTATAERLSPAEGF